MSEKLSLDQILAAQKFSDIFSSDNRKAFRQALKATHPDLHPGEEEKAKQAFVRVNKLWKMRTSADSDPTLVESDSIGEDTLYSKKHEYSKLKLRRKANGVNHYVGVMDGVTAVIVSVASNPRVGEALLDGVRSVKEAKNSMPETYREFFPDIVDAFHIIQGGTKLSGIAQQLGSGFYSLREVFEDYPEGIHGRDAAWMFRRMLVAVGNLHDYGFGHGGISLDSFLVEPETHRLIMQDFQYVSQLGSNVQMVNSFSKPYFEKDRTVSVEKDLRMVSSLMLRLTNEKLAPKRLLRFFKGASSFPAASAAEMLGDFDYVLSEVYGERVFHEFRMKRS